MDEFTFNLQRFANVYEINSSNTVVSGTDENDKFISSYRSDNLIYANGGNDYVEDKLGKNTTIYGGDGEDTVSVVSSNTSYYVAYFHINGESDDDYSYTRR